MAIFEISQSDGWINCGSPSTIQKQSTHAIQVRESGNSEPTGDFGIMLDSYSPYVPEYTGGGTLWARNTVSGTTAILVTED